jgi:hypothetical protein
MTLLVLDMHVVFLLKHLAFVPRLTTPISRVADCLQLKECDRNTHVMEVYARVTSGPDTKYKK